MSITIQSSKGKLGPQSSVLKTESSSSALGPQYCDHPPRWLITGGCGFIGTSLIKHLVKNNLAMHIRVLDNLSVGTREDLARVCNFIETDSSPLNPQPSVLSTQFSSLNPDNVVELIVGDIRDPNICMLAAQGMDVIVHLAANTGVGPSVEDPRKDMEVNVIGTLNMLEAARHNHVKRFVFASSGAPVGEVEPPIHEELAPHPVSPYGASKLAGEGYCSAYFRTYGVETVALRFGNVYGPGSNHKNSVIAKFIRQAKKGEDWEIYGDGNQTRDFIYIDDLVEAIIRASDLRLGDSFPWGEVFQIATNKEHTINEIADMLREELESRFGITIHIKHGEPRLGDVRRNFSDTSRAKKSLGWDSRVNLQEALAKTVSWFWNL